MIFKFSPEYLSRNRRCGSKYGLGNAHNNQYEVYKNPEIWLFAKMAPKTTSNSGFHFSSEFGVLELIENNINIDRVCGRLFEIFRAEV